MPPRRPRPRPASLDRRQALAALGRLGAALVVGCGSAPEGPACVLGPRLTAGPYWVDERLDRSDLRWDTHRLAAPDPRPGVPLTLDIRLLTPSEEGCRPLRGAQVDLWHCDALGVYSDVPGTGTAGQNFLRGYQVTDAGGTVTFTTIYPGWYPGRAVHIHAKVRLFDPFAEVTTEVSTQLFFDDEVTDGVLATAPYADRGPRDTRNAVDPVYRGQGALLVLLEGSPTAGYQGEVALGVRVGEIQGA